MPSLGWIALATVLSAAIGAAIARAVGRAYRDSGHSPRRALSAARQPEIGSAESQEGGLLRSRASSNGIAAVPPSLEATVRMVADTDQPETLTGQRYGSEGTASGRSWMALPGPAGSEHLTAVGHEFPAGRASLLSRLREAMGAGASAVGRWPVWRSVTVAHPELLLALVAAAFYLVSRLWAIDTFPLFFYSDEVNYVLFGEQAYQHGLSGEDGSWPAVFVLWDTNRWGPALGIYLQGLMAFTFGRTVWVARATEALVSLGGVLAVALILKDRFRSRFWWASILLAASIPAWFLYTRTAFSVATAASLYALFLLAYMRYRFHSPRSLGLAAVAGAAAFYSYNNMMLVMGVLTACLLVSDFRYHILHRRIWLRSLPILALLTIPLVEFRILHPEAIRANLSAVASYWVEEFPLAAKLLHYVQNYLYGLSPVYWFAPELGTGILPTQFIPGAGHMGYFLLPLVGIGLYVAFRNLKSSRYRLVLLSALAVPASSALDTIEIYRVLAMVVPALILGTLGLEQLSIWLKAIPRGIQTAAVAGLLFVVAIARFLGGVVNGPTWATEYGLHGTQFGAKVLYEDTIPALLAEDPATTLIMNTTWANNAHIYPRFFLSQSDQERVRFGNVRDYLARILPLEPGTVIVMLPEEYADAVASPMLGELEIVKTVYRPDGEPGFYFAHIAYVADAGSVAQDLAAIRAQLVESQVDILGQPTRVLHSRLADGNISNLFDGSTETLIRGDDANPFQLEIRFPQPRQLDRISVTTGSFGDFSVRVTVTLPGVGEPLVVSERYRGMGPDPTVSLSIPSAGAEISSLRFEVTDNTQGPTGIIHVREIAFH